MKWRLGTELPPDFAEKLPGDKPFPSGTAYEILTAIEKRQHGGQFPDIYVFRYTGSSPAVAIDDPKRATIERDWGVLKGFFQEWFLTERGHFKAAFNPYTSEDDFEAQLEKLLRKWVADKVTGGRVVRWPIDVKGSPFRGLAAFGAKHAPVLFGRSEDTSRAVELWREAYGRKSAYLLIVGASGSGKSSLVRASAIPRLTTPGVIKEVDAWRIAVMRPGDSPAGPFAALAAALMQDEVSLPKDEEGRGSALPEIAQGDSRTPAELAAVLRNAAAAAAIKPILNALTRVGAGERDREQYGREVRCDLVLLIDQFEELFAGSISEDERRSFIELVAALVDTGRVWVAATLRADFYARMLGQPTLRKLKERGATYDLAPPGPVELAEIVRGPAEAAGLVFETDAATGERLDARLLRDAARPDMLPLVQLALSRLFEGRQVVGGEIVLPVKVYEGLGGLRGIINEAGEKALASLGETEKARLPRLLRQLAVPAHDEDRIGKGALTIRALPLKEAAPDETTRRLVDALITARLLTTSGLEADAQVRLPHQRVLEDWNRARAIVAESADFYRIRADLEESRRKWEAGKRRGELLLARGLPLAEAESIVAKYRDELAAEELAYVRASRARANRTQMIAWSAAAVFFLVAVGAGAAAWVAIDQRSAAVAARAQAEQETRRADAAAKDALEQRATAETARAQALQALKVTTQSLNGVVFELEQDVRLRDLPADLRNEILYAALWSYDQVIGIYPDYADALVGRGAAYFIRGDFDRAIADLSQAVVLDPKNGTAYGYRGLAYFRKNDFDHALADYNEALVLEPKNAGYYGQRGVVYWNKGDLDRAIVDYTQAVTLDPKNAEYYNYRGYAYYSKRDFDRAIADYDQAILIDAKTALYYGNRGLAYYDKGDFDSAIADDNAAIKINPKSAFYYNQRGNAYYAENDFDNAFADYNKAVRLGPKCVVAYNNRGLIYYRKGDLARAIADFTEAITLDPKYVYAYAHRGNAYFDELDFDNAIADYSEAIKVDPTYVYAYAKRGNAYRSKKDFDSAIADYTKAIALDPKNGDYHDSRGLAYDQLSDFDNAIADYGQAIALDPKNAFFYEHRATAYGKKRDFDHAIADYSQAIALMPIWSFFWTDRAFAYFSIGDFDRAIDDYTQAISLNPKFVDAYYWRGGTYLEKADFDKAMADYTEAIRLNPKYVFAYINRAVVYYRKGEVDNAIADCASAIALDPKNAWAYAIRGVAYQGTGNFDQALSDLDEAIRLDAKHAKAHYYRAMTYLYLGSLPKALADLDAASKLDASDAYVAIWLDIVDKRSGAASRLAQTVAQIDMTKWPAPVIRLYLGQSTAADVLAAADNPNTNKKKEQICDADQYIGELALQRHDANEAARLFQIAVKECPEPSIELLMARAELKALGEGP